MSRERTGRPSFAGIPFRVCIFFAANPDEWLDTSDVGVKFGLHPDHVCATLKHVVAAGYLAKRVGGGITRTVYTIGPTLLEMIGRTHDWRKAA